MNEAETRKILLDVGAIIADSHIVYTSGRHGSAYVNKDAVYPHTEITSKLCKEMAGRFKNTPVDAVAGPTVGGVILSQWVAHYLSEIYGREIYAVFAEEDENKNRFFKRGYDKLITGKNVLVVEDVLTTGGSVKRVVDAARTTGGKVVGCVAICNRGKVSAKDLGDIPRLESLINIDMDSWEEKDCPMCKEGTPVNTDVGRGREYLNRRGRQ